MTHTKFVSNLTVLISLIIQYSNQYNWKGQGNFFLPAVIWILDGSDDWCLDNQHTYCTESNHWNIEVVSLKATRDMDVCLHLSVLVEAMLWASPAYKEGIIQSVYRIHSYRITSELEYICKCWIGWRNFQLQ